MEIWLDPMHGRVTQNDSRLIALNKTISNIEQCSEMQLKIKFNAAKSDKKLEFEMHYEIFDTVPDSEEFCSTCFAVDPALPKVVKADAFFLTGCGKEKCITDLRLTSSLTNDYKFVLGSTKKLSIKFTVTNYGQNSFYTQLNVSTTGLLPFMATPSGCKKTDYAAMTCVLRSDMLGEGGSTDLWVDIDVSRVSADFEVHASSFSSNNEMSNRYNTLVLKVPLTEFSKVQVTG